MLVTNSLHWKSHHQFVPRWFGDDERILRYSKEQSTLVLPSESAIDFMSWKYNRTPTYVKNNFAKLNVYFEALNYETVEQKKAYEGKTPFLEIILFFDFSSWSSRWYWWTDGIVYWCLNFNNFGTFRLCLWSNQGKNESKIIDLSPRFIDCNLWSITLKPSYSRDVSRWFINYILYIGPKIRYQWIQRHSKVSVFEWKSL